MPTLDNPGVQTVIGVKEDEPMDSNAVYVNSLQFSFPGSAPFISEFSLKLPAGSRCLLCGANGAGKSTVLQLLAGKYMVSKDSLRILGRPPFHDTALTCDGELAYLGGTWRRDVAFAGDVPLQGDMSAREMIFGVKGVNPERRDYLVKMLDIDLDWNLMRTSDGQRRRVQIAMGLLKEYTVLFMDEITVDLDVLSRLDLLRFFKSECEDRGATIIYATHIFDGMEKWATHLAYMEEGLLIRGGPTSNFPELEKGTRLLDVMESWLREESKQRKLKKKTEPSAGTKTPVSSPFMPSKHLAFYR